MIDENTTALREYEQREYEQREYEAHYMTWESILINIRPLVEEMRTLKEVALGFGDFVKGYDFERDILAYINDELKR